MNNIQDTSFEAYIQRDKMKVRQDYLTLLNAIKSLGEANNTMLVRFTGLPINVVCPRMFELRQKGHLELVGKKPCPIRKERGITVTTRFWRIRQ